MQNTDWKWVANIYQQGIASGNATFQTDVPSWEYWDQNHLNCCRIVADTDGRVAGWAALSAISKRAVYSGVAEVSIYVSNDMKGKGLGSLLMEKLIESSETAGIWTLQSSIFRENKASIRLHKSYGFRLVGYREKIGNMNGVWRDTVIYERRSRKAGV